MLHKHVYYLHHDWFSFDITAAGEQIQRSPGMSESEVCLTEVSRWSQLRGAYLNWLSEATVWLHLPRASVILQLSRFNTDYCYPAERPFLYFACFLFTRTDSWHGLLHVKQVSYSYSRTQKNKNSVEKDFFFSFQFSFGEDGLCRTLMWFKLTEDSGVSGVSRSETVHSSASAL